MPEMEKLKSVLPGSVLVATADLFHHGVAYGTSVSESAPISKEVETLTVDIIQTGFRILGEQNYSAFNDYCSQFRSDGVDVLQVLTYLMGPLKSQILDLKLVDTTHLYENDPSPSWVAATLIEMTPF